MKILICLVGITLSIPILAQKTSLSFELNGRPSNERLQDSLIKSSKSPFVKFIGEWTLKEDTWKQNWGGQTETIKIPNHHTISAQLNTNNSLLSIIDGPEPNGHIFWSYNPNTQEVHHLSSFGEIRVGVGQGTVNKNGDVRLKITFEGEPKNTYRIYTYQWINPNEYVLKSIQYNEQDQPTGLFYGGNFVRLENSVKDAIQTEIKEILHVLDDLTIMEAQRVSVFAEDVVHMAPNHAAITNKTALLTYLKEQKKYGYANMEHQIVEVESFEEAVVMRGRVIGTFFPSNGDQPFEFKTKNLFVFKRIDGALKISKVIYNSSPN